MAKPINIVENCRFCETNLSKPFLDLGSMPFANNFLKKNNIAKETNCPLAVCICPNCLLVQLQHTADPKHIFSDYAYFSSYSSTWLKHAENYVEHMQNSFGINEKSKILEIGSNDGYLLKYFSNKNINVMGIEPAKNIAEQANKNNINTKNRFFNTSLAKQLKSSGYNFDLIIANNVLAHCPNINNFITGIKILLSENGIVTIEVPHLLNLIKHNQFDTIYHEHYFYFSIMSLSKIFSQHNLKIFNIDKLSTHGGSLRIFIAHNNSSKWQPNQTVSSIIKLEKQANLDKPESYYGFNIKINKIKQNLLNYLKKNKSNNKSIVAYGAPAKGNTLLNYCGITKSLIDFTVDKNQQKQNCLLPGSNIPVYSPEYLKLKHPDIILILPWNIKQEIIEEITSKYKYQGEFVTAIPKLNCFQQEANFEN